jgi:hypothetical protein
MPVYLDNMHMYGNIHMYKKACVDILFFHKTSHALALINNVWEEADFFFTCIFLHMLNAELFSMCICVYIHVYIQS